METTESIPSIHSENENNLGQLHLIQRPSMDPWPISRVCKATGTLLCQRVTIFWVAGTGLALWLFLIHGPTTQHDRPVRQDPLLLIHILGAASIYFACIHNSLLTPSLGSFVRFCHVNLGRAGFVMGVASFITGFILSVTRIRVTNPRFPIRIATGAFQMYAQYQGYQAIQRYRDLKRQEELLLSRGSDETPRSDEASVTCYLRLTESTEFTSIARTVLADQKEEAIRQHISAMIPLFVLACGIPAIIRVSESISDRVVVLLAFVGFMQLVSMFYTKAFLATRNLKEQPRHPPESHEESYGATTGAMTIETAVSS
jgi:hypothetical protein